MAPIPGEDGAAPGADPAHEVDKDPVGALLSRVLLDATAPAFRTFAGTAEAVRGLVCRAVELRLAGLLLPPGWLPAGGFPPQLRTPHVIAACGVGTVGRQHVLVKAAEARLAAQCGVAEVTVALDPVLVRRRNHTAVLTELAAVGEAVGNTPFSAYVAAERTGLCFEDVAWLAGDAARAGAAGVMVDGPRVVMGARNVVSPCQKTHVQVPLTVVGCASAYRAVAPLIDAGPAGAARLGLADPEALAAELGARPRKGNQYQ